MDLDEFKMAMRAINIYPAYAGSIDLAWHFNTVCMREFMYICMYLCILYICMYVCMRAMNYVPFVCWLY
jgi:hypothetical protein